MQTSTLALLTNALTALAKQGNESQYEETRLPFLMMIQELTNLCLFSIASVVSYLKKKPMSFTMFVQVFAYLSFIACLSIANPGLFCFLKANYFFFQIFSLLRSNRAIASKHRQS